MRILLLSQRFLFPMDTGGKIRTGKILQQLSENHEVTVVGNFEPERDAPHETQMRDACARYVGVPWREPQRGSAAFYWRVARNCLSAYPVTALNDYSAALEAALLETLNAGEFDLAICDFVQSALLFRRVRGLPRLLFQHNVEAAIAERHMRNAGNPLLRTFWKVQYERMRRFEAEAVRSFDAVVAVSERDAAYFMDNCGAREVHAIPTGVDVDFYRGDPAASQDSDELAFCGSMDWLPNEDGIRWFLEEIAPVLDGAVQSWRLTVVGRNPSEWLRRVASERRNLSLTGWVDDVRPYLDRAAACIVPLRIGGGTRMKIYEAMAMSKAVVSTRVGAEGLVVDHGTNICLADPPGEFAHAVAGLLADPGARQCMGEAARGLVEEHFGWDKVALRFADICRQTVETCSGGAGSRLTAAA